MDYTRSDANVTDTATGNRMHQGDQPVTTLVSPEDMNMVIWSLMEVLKYAGLDGLPFDKNVPDSYGRYLTALKLKFADVGGSASNRFRSAAYVAGTEVLSGPTIRDGFVAGRNLVGATNCHGFADRTIMSGVSDAGQYGSFDCTVELQGSHNQNHVYSFQDRVRYAGGAGGVLQNSTGFLSQAIHSGAGQILRRKGVEIDPMLVTGGGTIDEQIGVCINHQGTATNNVGLFIGQTAAGTGWSVYAPGGGKGYHAGRFGFGMEPSAGVPVSFKDPSSASNTEGFLSSDLSRVTLGSMGNVPVAIVTNGQARVVVDGSAGSHGLRPNGDNTQPLGGPSYRWAVLHTGTSPIVTSNELEKEQIQEIDLAVFRAWGRVEWSMYKYRDSVATKGGGARWHTGLVAQRVKLAFEAEGLDPFAYGVLCLDKWDDHYEMTPAVFHDTFVDYRGLPMLREEPSRVLVREAGERYGIRYDEAQAIEAAYLRHQLQLMRQG